MLVVVLGMLVCITLAVTVLGMVAVPAVRDGEALFLPREDSAEDAAEHAAERPADVTAGTTAAVADLADTGTVDDLLGADRGARQAAHV